MAGLHERFYRGDKRAATGLAVWLRDDNEQTWRELGSHDDCNRRASAAWAVLCDALGDEVRAKAVYDAFQERVVAIWPERWTMTRTRVLAYVTELEHAAVQRATVERARRGAYRR